MPPLSSPLSPWGTLRSHDHVDRSVRGEPLPIWYLHTQAWGGQGSQDGHSLATVGREGPLGCLGPLLSPPLVTFQKQKGQEGWRGATRMGVGSCTLMVGQGDTGKHGSGYQLGMGWRSLLKC